MSNTLSSLTPAQLRLAANLKEKITKLDKKLSAILGASASTPAEKPKRRGMSTAGRARVAAAQKARWAKIRAAKK